MTPRLGRTAFAATLASAAVAATIPPAQAFYGSFRASATTIEDDGPGIAEADREAIFDPFFRVDRSRNRDTGGTGLGLAIARQIVTAHGGTIAVAADRRSGTAFEVLLPADQNAGPNKRPAIEADPAVLGSPKP